MTPTVVQRFRRLLDAGSRRMDFSRPGGRLVLALLVLAAVALLATAAWFAHLDSRTVTVTFAELRPAYVNRVREKLQAATDAAADEASRLGEARALRLRFIVNRDGGLNTASVVESSGNRAVDDLALRVVRESAPFEPFPVEMRRYTNTVEITSTFNFR